jgi:hypothetical protein
VPACGGDTAYDRRVSPEVGRLLLIAGLVVAGIGLLAVLGIRIPLGQLPGDIRIEGKNGVVFIPLTTMILVSVVLTVILALARRSG